MRHLPRKRQLQAVPWHRQGALGLALGNVERLFRMLRHRQVRQLRRTGPAVSRQGEQGCRASRKPPIDERLARRDQARHELRQREMRGAKNWRD